MEGDSDIVIGDWTLDGIADSVLKNDDISVSLTEAILALIERLRRTAPAGEVWRPIETAPRGVKVLAGYFNALGKWRTVMASYYEPNTLESHDEGSGFAAEGWYEESETHDDILPIDEPTLWQPLPAPPAAKNARESTERGEADT